LTTHIMRLGTLLCGHRPNYDAGNWVNCMALPVRFHAVDCAACLKQQIVDCHERAERETTPTSADCERAAESVCRGKLTALKSREAS
jgi:hypothetical protein